MNITKLEDDMINLGIRLHKVQLISGFFITLQSVLLIWAIFENTCP